MHTFTAPHNYAHSSPHRVEVEHLQQFKPEDGQTSKQINKKIIIYYLSFLVQLWCIMCNMQLEAWCLHVSVLVLYCYLL